MKKSNLFFTLITVLGMAFLFASCGETYVNSPEVTLEPNSDTVGVVAAPGESVEFTFAMSSEYTDASWQYDIYEGANELVAKTDYTVAATYTFEVPADAAKGDSYTLVFTAYIGEEDNMVTNSKSVTIDVDPGFPVLTVYSGVTMTYVSTDAGSSFLLNTSDGQMYPGDNADASALDIAFVWQNTYGYSLVSPDAGWIADLLSINGETYTTSDKNHTKIMKYTGTWEDLTDEAVDALTVTEAEITGGGFGVQGVEEGEIIVFETAAGTKGAIKVGTNAKVTKNMTADVKVQTASAAKNGQITEIVD